MAKAITPTPPQATRSDGATNPIALADAITQRDQRIATLEAQLREASDTITALRLKGAPTLKPSANDAGETVTPYASTPLMLPWDLCDANQAAACIPGGQITLRFHFGAIGGRRLQRFFSLAQRGRENHLTMANGEHVDKNADGIYWLLDNIRLGAKDVQPENKAQVFTPRA